MEPKMTGSHSPIEFSTADLVDAHGASLQSCELQFRQYGGRVRFHGPVRTVKTFEDNALIKQVLSESGDGAVLVVDGGGSLRSALVGDVIASLAVRNGWSGLLVWGAVRDTTMLAELAIGLKALGSNPWKSGKAGSGQVNVPVSFGGVTFRPGEWLYSDEDGVVLSRSRL